jgi:hypothetical protein
MNLSIADIINIVISILFGALSVLMFVRFKRLHKKVIVQDQQWSVVRIMFLVLGVLAFLSLVYQGSSNTIFDYLRLGMTLIVVTAYMAVRDGIGEDGLVSAGKMYPWNIVRAYDYEERKNVIAVYFTIESQNEKKPDEYTTKELDFSVKDKEYLMEFLKANIHGKFTRMKKKSKK